jgi:hypothetical protein
VTTARRPTYALARHGVDPPPGDLLDALVPDGLDGLDDLLAVVVASWARKSARDRGCRCSTWLDTRTTRTDPHEVVVEVWGHDSECPAGPHPDGRDRWAVTRL